MTGEEILKLEACNETDALIAEKVMEWHVDIDKQGWKSWRSNSSNAYQHPVAHDDAPYEDAEDLHTIFWHPSQSLLWAWEVVEKLCNETGCDVVRVCRRDETYLAGKWSCNFGRGFEAFADTPALAICRAALLTTLGEDV